MGNQKEKLNWESLERQDGHLWNLAVMLIFIMGLSLLSFMIPPVFWFSTELSVKAPQRAFFGFILLLALILVYLFQRQATIRQLKRSLYKAQAAAVSAEQRANLISFTALPEIGQFRDSLAMEFRRASHSGEHLAAVLLDMPGASEAERGLAANLLRTSLRNEETLFRLSESGLGVILPGKCSQEAKSFAAQIMDQIGQSIRNSHSKAGIIAYPEEVSSFAEFEERLRTFIQ